MTRASAMRPGANYDVFSIEGIANSNGERSRITLAHGDLHYACAGSSFVEIAGQPPVAARSRRIVPTLVESSESSGHQRKERAEDAC